MKREKQTKKECEEIKPKVSKLEKPKKENQKIKKVKIVLCKVCEHFKLEDIIGTCKTCKPYGYCRFWSWGSPGTMPTKDEPITVHFVHENYFCDYFEKRKRGG